MYQHNADFAIPLIIVLVQNILSIKEILKKYPIASRKRFSFNSIYLNIN